MYSMSLDHSNRHLRECRHWLDIHASQAIPQPDNSGFLAPHDVLGSFVDGLAQRFNEDTSRVAGRLPIPREFAYWRDIRSPQTIPHFTRATEYSIFARDPQNTFDRTANEFTTIQDCEAKALDQYGRLVSLDRAAEPSKVQYRSQYLLS
jgi:hypothetical protein